MSLLQPYATSETPTASKKTLQPNPTSSSSPSRPFRTSRIVAESKADLPWLISQFGDASSSNWLEEKYGVWRGEGSTEELPKVQGYLKHHKWVFAWGAPLAEPTHEKRKAAAEEFVGWAKSEKLKVVWCCVDSEFEKVLAEGVNGVGWSTLSCLKEDVLRESCALVSPLSLSWYNICLSVYPQTPLASASRAATSSATSAEPSVRTSSAPSFASRSPTTSPTSLRRRKSTRDSRSGARVGMDSGSTSPRWVVQSQSDGKRISS